MSEARLWEYVRDGVGPLWEAQRHEDRHSLGIPDVSYSTDHHGWIELKYLPAAPKRPTTIMKVDHFTAEQRNWLTKHGRRGGHCFILLQVGACYLLFSWADARKIGQMTFDEHKKTALTVWEGRMNFTEFVARLA